MAITKVKSGVRTLGTGEVAIGNISGSAAGAAGTFLKQDGTWAAVASGIEWQAVQTTGFTAVAERGYPCNTTASAFTVTLPAAASVGDQIAIVDYAGTFDTNKVTINSNGLNLKGSTDDVYANKERVGLVLTYVDSTQGWVVTSASNDGTGAIVPTTYSVDFLVIAGGGAGGHDQGGGGGAGGYRASWNSEASGGGGSSETSLTFDAATVYTISVGAGGAGISSAIASNPGVDSYISGSDISTITSAGGGRGGLYNTTGEDMDGGSGGGRGAGPSYVGAGGAGTTNQGYAGGSSITNVAGAGGGASAVGGNAVGSTGGTGGAGVASTITGPSVLRGGGGGGAAHTTGRIPGAGGSGGGGNGSTTGHYDSSVDGDANTGGGGGGTWGGSPTGSGGSGVIALRIATASYSGTTTGSPTVTTNGLDTILFFTGSGSYTG